MIERKNSRLRNFDYSTTGAYFMTVNVKGREERFGAMRHGHMVLNAGGIFAHVCMQEISAHFPGCYVDEFVVMPDHVHGIIVIDENTAPTGNASANFRNRTVKMIQPRCSMLWYWRGCIEMIKRIKI